MLQFVLISYNDLLKMGSYLFFSADPNNYLKQLYNLFYFFSIWLSPNSVKSRFDGVKIKHSAMKNFICIKSDKKVFMHRNFCVYRLKSQKPEQTASPNALCGF